MQELRLVQKQDKQGKDVMWCFVEFDEIVQAARCMKVLQVRTRLFALFYIGPHIGLVFLLLPTRCHC